MAQINYINVINISILSNKNMSQSNADVKLAVVAIQAIHFPFFMNSITSKYCIILSSNWKKYTLKNHLIENYILIFKLFLIFKMINFLGILIYFHLNQYNKFSICLELIFHNESYILSINK